MALISIQWINYKRAFIICSWECCAFEKKLNQTQFKFKIHKLSCASKKNIYCSHYMIMESKDILWLLLFTLLLLLSNFLCFLIVGSLRSKAIGLQSIYDQVFQDTFLVGNFFCSWICLVVIVSRFSWFRILISESNLLLTLICGTTAFARHAGIVLTCCFCIIRILCLFRCQFHQHFMCAFFVQKWFFQVTFWQKSTFERKMRA